jgi:hypothetical protein
MDISQFRVNFPEFADTTKYPDAMISFEAAIAERQVRQDIWTNMWPTGVSLYVAHNIAISAVDRKTSSFGGTPGTSAGIVNQKAIGGASASYDATTQTEAGGGHWNRTTYGQRFLRLARLFGARAIQL